MNNNRSKNLIINKSPTPAPRKWTEVSGTIAPKLTKALLLSFLLFTLFLLAGGLINRLFISVGNFEIITEGRPSEKIYWYEFADKIPTRIILFASVALIALGVFRRITKINQLQTAGALLAFCTIFCAVASCTFWSTNDLFESCWGGSEQIEYNLAGELYIFVTNFAAVIIICSIFMVMSRQKNFPVAYLALYLVAVSFFLCASIDEGLMYAILGYGSTGSGGYSSSVGCITGSYENITFLLAFVCLMFLASSLITIHQIRGLVEREPTMPTSTIAMKGALALATNMINVFWIGAAHRRGDDSRYPFDKKLYPF